LESGLCPSKTSFAHADFLTLVPLLVNSAQAEAKTVLGLLHVDFLGLQGLVARLIPRVVARNLLVASRGGFAHSQAETRLACTVLNRVDRCGDHCRPARGSQSLQVGLLGVADFEGMRHLSLLLLLLLASGLQHSLSEVLGGRNMANFWQMRLVVALAVLEKAGGGMRDDHSVMAAFVFGHLAFVVCVGC